MGYFKDKMRKIINWAISDDYAIETSDRKWPNPGTMSSMSNKSIGGLLGSNGIEGHDGGMNFTVYSATGGKVIQIRTYNANTDQSRSTLYVVTDKEDLGQELGQIITVESLSR